MLYPPWRERGVCGEVVPGLEGAVDGLERVHDHVAHDGRGLRLHDRAGDADVRVDKAHAAVRQLLELKMKN